MIISIIVHCHPRVSRNLNVFRCHRFEGISWNSNETLIAYVAEEASPSKPTFNDSGYKKGGSADKDCGSWKGQGEWEEDWGETYAGKRQPALFLIDINRFCKRFLLSLIQLIIVFCQTLNPQFELSHAVQRTSTACQRNFKVLERWPSCLGSINPRLASVFGVCGLVIKSKKAWHKILLQQAMCIICS